MHSDEVESTEELNEERKAEHEEAKTDRSVVGAVEGVVDTFVRPLLDRPASPEEREEQREENDEEQRPE